MNPLKSRLVLGVAGEARTCRFKIERSTSFFPSCLSPSLSERKKPSLSSEGETLFVSFFSAEEELFLLLYYIEISPFKVSPVEIWKLLPLSSSVPSHQFGKRR